MNLHQYITKYRGSDSKLETVVRESGDKAQFYWEAINKFEAETIREIDWYSHRMERYYSVTGAPRSCTFFLDCTSRLVIGQGVSSVLETHLSTHPVYGVPFIPGSALKGLAAHYCHNRLGQNPTFRMNGSSYNVLFGNQEKAGMIHYCDAFPTPETVADALHLDILTPHHQKYNQLRTNDLANGQNAPSPRDDDSPVPVPFLTVKAKFRVLLTCESDQPEADEWLEIAKTIVTKAAEQEGLGGKTNSGYGQMRSV